MQTAQATNSFNERFCSLRQRQQQLYVQGLSAGGSDHIDRSPERSDCRRSIQHKRASSIDAEEPGYSKCGKIEARCSRDISHRASRQSWPYAGRQIFGEQALKLAPSPIDFDYDNLFAQKPAEPWELQTHRKKSMTLKKVQERYGWLTHGISEDLLIRNAGGGDFFPE